MERTRRTRVLTVAAAAMAVAPLAGCSAGFDATSIEPYAPSDGVLANSGQLRILNALVVSSNSGTAGVISASIVNRGTKADELVDISSPDGTFDLTGDGTLRRSSAVRLGAGTRPSATMTGLTKLPGETITVTMTFRRADPLTIETVVVPATGPYASITPAPTSVAE